ncbi:MAG: hypothetical protein AUK44_07265 [Porphyromonadaceae bacterium CG2_30_38_12]|nr:MAG: hypothetical protein AUK44_07265 [Porphyromonadaceae bacterium CG2_30_38_12]
MSSVSLFFTKQTDSLVVGNVSFNVLKICNPTSQIVAGKLTINGPEDWKIISIGAAEISIPANDTSFIPIHISPSMNAVGGVSYLINANLRTAQRLLMASCNLTVAAHSKWDFSVYKNKLFFTETNPKTTIQIRLANKGNTNEVLKLDYKVGKLLSFRDNTNVYTEYINLGAYKDTTIYQTISSQVKMTDAQKQRYLNNWKETSVIITASSDKEIKSTALQMHKLNSVYVNQRNESASPLNVDYQMYNLMSNQPIRTNFRLYGSLLFSKNREIQYSTGIQSIYLGSTNEKFNSSRQLLYNLKYISSRSFTQVGYNVSNSSLHAINGRGVVGQFRFKDNSQLSYALIQNPYSLSWAQSVGISKNIKRFSVSTELVNEQAASGLYKASSVALGTGFSVFKNHSFTLEVLGSKVGLTLNGLRDTSVIGFSYRASYSVRYKNFGLRLNTMSSAHNYISNSGLQQTYLDGKYKLNDKVYFTLYGNRQFYATSGYPSNFYNPVNYNSTDYARIAVSFYAGNVIYQVGPNYSGSSRQVLNSFTNYKNEFVSYQPGLWCAATIKLPGYRSITPNVTINNIRFRFRTNDPSLDNFSLNNNLFYSVGLNYYDNVWRVNAYYTSGSTSDLYRSVQVDEKPTLSSSLQFRPSYENYFFQRKVKLSAYLNYAYYMPSARENISYNVRYDQFLKGGWNLSVSGFMYTNVRVLSNEQGRVSSKDMNVVVGVSKSFNIQQPRQKYHNMKVLFFNDLDGNKQKSDNEPPVRDILVNIEKEQIKSNERSSIPEINLISDQNGSVTVENLPRDNYKLSFAPASNLEYLYFLNGSDQIYYNNKNGSLYVPLAESYKIKGRIVLQRDPNSTEGKIDLGGVRITATAANGENYAVLTDNTGSFVLSVPNANRFKLKINNVFGQYFQIDNDEIDVQFTQSKTIQVDFTFIEKRREIQFDNSNQLYKFNNISN